MYDVFYISGKGKRYLFKTFTTQAEAITFVNAYQGTHEHKYFLQIEKRPEGKNDSFGKN